jgi:hypothetical protein
MNDSPLPRLLEVKVSWIDECEYPCFILHWVAEGYSLIECFVNKKHSPTKVDLPVQRMQHGVAALWRLCVLAAIRNRTTRRGRGKDEIRIAKPNVEQSYL